MIAVSYQHSLPHVYKSDLRWFIHDDDGEAYHKFCSIRVRKGGFRQILDQKWKYEISAIELLLSHQSRSIFTLPNYCTSFEIVNVMNLIDENETPLCLYQGDCQSTKMSTPSIDMNS